MSFIIPYIWILSVTFSLILITEKKFEILIPLTFILGVFLFYLAGMLGSISLGLIFCGLLAIVWIPLLVLKRKKWKLYLKNTFTVGFVIFSLFYLYLCFYHRYTAFSTWDEFQHWGPMIKETLRLDNFYSIPASTLQTHKDYPPFVTLLQCLWCKLSGGYTEAYCYRAMSIFTISLFMPAFSRFSIKKIRDWCYSAIFAVMIILVNIISYCWFYALFETIYTDYLLGVFAAYAIYLVISSRGEFDLFRLINLSLSLASLLMIKQMGIAFYAMALFLIILISVFKTTIRKPDISTKKALIFCIAFVLIPLLIYKSWSWHIAAYHPDVQFSLSQISISDFIELIVHGTGEAWQKTTLINYIDAINHRPLISSPFALSYWPLNIIITLIILVFFHFFAKREIRYPSLIAFTYVIGFLGYSAAMLLLYVFSFGPEEGPILASFERYINTYIYFGLCLLILLFIEFLDHKSKKKSLPFLGVILCLFLLLCGPKQFHLLKIQAFYNGYEEDSVYTDLFNQIEANAAEGNQILLISQYQDQTVHILRYRYPLLKFTVISLGEPKYADDPYSQNLSLEEWIALYEQYDYAYTYSVDDEFYLKYWLPITDEYLLNERIYKINGNNFCLISADNSCE